MDSSVSKSSFLFNTIVVLSLLLNAPGEIELIELGKVTCLIPVSAKAEVPILVIPSGISITLKEFLLKQNHQP